MWVRVPPLSPKIMYIDAQNKAFPEAIQKRIEKSCEAKGWIIPGERISPDEKRHHSPGYYVGPGWLHIVEDLDTILAREDPDYLILQIKEKFGGLRYYVEHKNIKYANDIISVAETLSFSTCEICGDSGKVRTHRGRMQVRCDEHA